MFREKYNSMNEQIYPDQELVHKVANLAEEHCEKKNKSKRSFLKPIAILGLFMVVLFTVTPTLASKVPHVYDLMYLVSPTVAQYFMPIQEVSVDNGIKMEVVSAYVHENIAEIYITIQDLSGNRIDETTDLNDSYSINRPFDSSSTAENIGYDKETGKATFLITISEWGNRKITGDKITFSVSEFISGKKEYMEVPIEVDLRNIDNDPLTREVDINGGSGSEFEKYVLDFKTIGLVPSNSMDFPVKGIDFTGIGYIDDKLHIQTSVMNNLTKDNHGYFFLKDENDNRVDLAYDFVYTENYNSGNTIHYYECVLDIPQAEIDQYSIYGDFWIRTSFANGEWQVTFPLEDAK